MAKQSPATRNPTASQQRPSAPPRGTNPTSQRTQQTGAAKPAPHRLSSKGGRR